MPHEISLVKRQSNAEQNQDERFWNTPLPILSYPRWSLEARITAKSRIYKFYDHMPELKRAFSGTHAQVNRPQEERERESNFSMCNADQVTRQKG